MGAGSVRRIECAFPAKPLPIDFNPTFYFLQVVILCVSLQSIVSVNILGVSLRELCERAQGCIKNVIAIATPDTFTMALFSLNIGSGH